MEASDHVETPISPELVLVDPELAARARAALPDHPWPPVPRITAERPAPAPVARRRSFPTGLLAFTLAAVSVLVGLSLLPTPDRPTFAAAPASEGEARPEQQPAPVSPVRVPNARRQVTSRRPQRPVRQRPLTRSQEADSQPRQARTARRAPRSTSQRPPAQAKRRARPGRRTPALRLTRGPSFAWPPVASARRYHAVFLRNGRTLYQARTRLPRLRLPARIRFTPGVYRWIVRPVVVFGLRTQLGRPIVDATFRVDGD